MPRTRDPFAMDVDYRRLSTEEQARLRKEGKYFNCKKPGHMSCQCPDKRRKKPFKKRIYQMEEEEQEEETQINRTELIKQMVSQCNSKELETLSKLGLGF